MRRNYRLRRGMSLSEMSVSLAVLAIASAAVASFAVMVGGRVAASRVRLTASEDLEAVKSITEGWLDAMLAEGAVLCVSGEADAITAEVGGDTYTFSFNEGRILGEYPSGENAVYKADTIADIEFSSMQNSADTIYFCTVTYTVDSDDIAPTVFTVDPMVGKTFTVETDGVPGGG